MNGIILTIVFIILIVGGIVGFFGSYKMLKVLKLRHKDIWEELGKPTFILNSIKSNLSVFRFLKNKEYERIEDSDFISLCKFNRLYGSFYLIIFGAIQIVFLFILMN